MDERFFELLHLGDSALPAGGYAFSSGLEGAYHLGLLQGEGALEEYLGCYVAEVGRFEWPYAAVCFGGDDEEIGQAALGYDAALTAPAMRRGSEVMGRNWLRLLERLYPGEGVKGVRQSFAGRGLPVHYALAFGAGLAAVGWGLAESGRLFLYQALRDQVSAAVRLGAVGPLAATRLQMGMYPLCRRVAEEEGERGWRQACRGAPLIELAQLHHGQLYSRLFQS